MFDIAGYGFTVDRIILDALKEDMPDGDITTDAIFGDDSSVSVSDAVIKAKEDGVICGLGVAERVFELLDGDSLFTCRVKEGEKVRAGDIVADLRGMTSALLKGERTALNLLQRMSGIATMTRAFCEKIDGLPVKLADTRKTTPGLRALEKYAVRVGGGSNHRFCLSDGAMIKDNHIKAAGGITAAVELVRKQIPHTVKIEVEAGNMEQVREALAAGADIIMLDNMDLKAMKEAVVFIGGRALTEASGNVDENRVRDIAETGVDIISAGKLTHSVKSLDISMKII